MDDKIPMVVVGLRFGSHVIDTHILKGLGKSHFKLVGVCDLIASVRESASMRYNVRSYSTLDEVLEDPSVRVIGLFTPPTHRADFIRKIIRAGKDVLTTKPLEKDPDAALAVLREAEKLGRIVHLNSPPPFPHVDLQQIMDWQAEHQLGQVIGARYEVWCSYREKADNSWYDDPEQCPVAPILRLGIYGINDLCRLLGTPTCVQVMQSRLFTQRPTSDNASLTIGFTNGAIATIFASFCINDRPGYRMGLTVNYENGTIWSDNDGLHIQARTPVGQVSVNTAPRLGSNEDYLWDTFARAVRGEKLEGSISPEDAVAGVRILQAMARAQSSGHTEPIHISAKDLPKPRNPSGQLSASL